MLAIALGLSFDTFAVSLSLGVVKKKILFREAVRVALVFALFQGGLTVTGYFLGSVISNALKTADHWIALGLLSILGIRMIRDGLKKSTETEHLDLSKTYKLLTIAVVTSIEAF